MEKAIYKITNNINGKCYIGQSIDPQHRFVAHCSRAACDADNSPIHAAIKKYGRENFSLEIIEWTENYNQREKELIIQYNSLAPNGYNVAPGGEEPPRIYGEAHHNCIVTEAQVDIIIAALKEEKLTEPEIGRLFDPPLNQPLIHNINFGITHRRSCEKYPIRTSCPYNLKKQEVEEIKWLLKNSFCSHHQIAEHYDVTEHSICAINTGRNHFDPSEDYPIRKFKGKRQFEPVETILAKRSTPAIDTQAETGAHACACKK